MITCTITKTINYHNKVGYILKKLCVSHVCSLLWKVRAFVFREYDELFFGVNGTKVRKTESEDTGGALKALQHPLSSRTYTSLGCVPPFSYGC